MKPGDQIEFKLPADYKNFLDSLFDLDKEWLTCIEGINNNTIVLCNKPGFVFAGQSGWMIKSVNSDLWAKLTDKDNIWIPEIWLKQPLSNNGKVNCDCSLKLVLSVGCQNPNHV